MNLTGANPDDDNFSSLQQAEEKIRGNEHRFRALIENSADAIAIMSIEGKLLYISPSVKKVLGYTEEEIKLMDIFSLVHPNDNWQSAKLMNEAIASPGFSVNGHPVRMRHKDGSWRWTEATLTNMLHDPSIRGIVSNYRDVTHRKYGEKKLICANCLYAFISQIDQTAVKVRNEQALFKKACNIAVEVGEFSACWIGIFDHENKKINIVEACGPLPEDVKRFKNLSYEDNGPQDHVLRTGVYYLCNNIGKDLQLNNWKLFAHNNGSNSCIVLPIMKSGKIAGTFNLYSAEINFFNAKEILLLEEATKDISSALDIFEKEKLNIKSDEKLRVGMAGISPNITEKKSLEELFDKASRLAKMGSWKADLVKNTLYWSAVTKEIHEVDINFIPGFETAINFYKAGSSRESISNAMRAAIKRGIPFDLELQIVTMKGNERWVRAIGTAEYVDGKLTQVLGSLQNIDTVKKSELQILKMYEEKNIILESIADAFFAVDKNWMVTYWNDHAERMLLIPRIKILGHNLWDVFLDSIHSAFYSRCHQAIEINQTANFENYYISLDKWFAISAYPSINGLSVYFKDITEQKKTETVLRQSELRYRQIVETVHEGIWLVDENNVGTFVNEKMCELFGYSQQEMLGKDIYYFMDAAGREDGLNLLERKNSLPANMDVRFITKSGKHIWANISANPIFDKDRIYKGALAMVTDITKEKILQQQLLKEQLNKQKEITKAAVNAHEKERGEIGLELHDNINQLLAATKLYLGHSLTQTDFAPFVIQSQEYISTAMEEIRKLSHALVGPGQNKTLGLIDSLSELINNLSVVKHIKMTFSHSPFDEDESEAGLKLVIYRIVQEQLNNIFKHAEASEVEVKLKNEAGYLQLIINDNGKGFDASIKRNGIGLNNIKNRAELYNGSVGILTSPGNGCKMKIVFKNNNMESDL